jgi:lysophospholipase L1-like esterase
MPRRATVVVVVLALIGLACKAEGGGTTPDDPPPSPVRGFPSSMVALGDSLTAGYGSCFAPTACPRNSWSTGDGPQVRSHYRRILGTNPAIRGHARNLARPGVSVDSLPGQARAAASQRVDYITVLIGANDACRGGIDGMTPPGDFRDHLDEALGTLKEAMPRARLLVVSIPNVYRVWEVGHRNRVALAAWRSGICPNLLSNATSTAPDDVERRRAFRDRIAAYNGQLRAACADYGSKCRYDNITSVNFDLNMLSAIDFFHPNAAGQSTLAASTYPGSFTW